MPDDLAPRAASARDEQPLHGAEARASRPSPPRPRRRPAPAARTRRATARAELLELRCSSRSARRPARPRRDRSRPRRMARLGRAQRRRRPARVWSGGHEAPREVLRQGGVDLVAARHGALLGRHPGGASVNSAGGCAQDVRPPARRYRCAIMRHAHAPPQRTTVPSALAPRRPARPRSCVADRRRVRQTTARLPRRPRRDAAPTRCDAAPEHVRIPYDGLPEPEAGPRTPVHAEFVSTRVDTMQLMFAAGEMQTSGEPFAQNFAGRNLAYYDRYIIAARPVPGPGPRPARALHQRTPTSSGSAARSSRTSTRSAHEHGGEPDGRGRVARERPAGRDAAGRHAARQAADRACEQLIFAAGTVVVGLRDARRAARGNPLNDFGFPGLWPDCVAVPRASTRRWRPTRRSRTRARRSPDTAASSFFGNSPVNEYECAYNSLQPAETARAQIEPVIGPGILGYTTWKEALWGVDFTGRLHDSQRELRHRGGAAGHGGRRHRRATRSWPSQPPGAAPGRLHRLDAARGHVGPADARRDRQRRRLAAVARSRPPTGRRSRASARSRRPSSTTTASPLVWYPTAIAVTEDGDDALPRRRLARDPGRHEQRRRPRGARAGLLALLRDDRRAQRRRRPADRPARSRSTARPSPPTTACPTARTRPHDRALAVMRVAFVDLDRIHADPATRRHRRHRDRDRGGARDARDDGDDDRARPRRRGPAAPAHGVQRRRLAVRRARSRPVARTRSGSSTRCPIHPPGTATPASALQPVRAPGAPPRRRASSATCSRRPTARWPTARRSRAARGPRTPAPTLARVAGRRAARPRRGVVPDAGRELPRSRAQAVAPHPAHGVLERSGAHVPAQAGRRGRRRDDPRALRVAAAGAARDVRGHLGARRPAARPRRARGPTSRA